ncbi:MAG: GatB/YqeY domain-containing protein [Gammaproteobacteria bacterium]|nr:MAG: GatB/YqeY domain-containing protein [Gammaproteobacteria bacterium]
MDLKTRINEAVKDAMRARERERLAALRLVTAEIKRVEVDERIEVDDARVLAILDKMIKQRLDSERQYRDANRPELAEVEAFEISLIREFMPEPLDEAAIAEMIEAAIAETGAEDMRAMGKVMGVLKPKIQGRADMAAVSAQVKQRLG